MTVAVQAPPAPYVGPRAFRHGETLYGRDREVAQLLDLLIAERIVLFYSPSGAGKTSLIQAALIPALEAEEFRVLPPIRVCEDPVATLDPEVRPANRYVLSALFSLEESVPREQRLPTSELAGLELSDYLHRRLVTAERRHAEVLIFDQFEEILTVDPTDLHAKHDFFRQVGAALRDHHHWALFSLREDYLAGLDPYRRHIPTHLATTFRLDLLDRDAACTAIQAPSRAAGVDFTDAAATKLVDDLRRVWVQQPDGTMQEQLGPYVEPVQLQVVCLRLWQHLPAGATQIVEADIGSVGSVDDALADYYADRVRAVAAETGVSERTVRQWVDRQLITSHGIRGQVLREPGRSQGLDNHAIALLENSHLVRAEKRRGAIWYELAHDRLIKPVQANNAAWFKANLSALQLQAELWERQDRPTTLLLRDRALVEVERWAADHDDDLTAVEREFLETCRQARAEAERERRRGRLIRRLSIASLIGLLAMVGLVYYYLEAGRQTRLALSRGLLVQALNHLHQLDLALLLSLEAIRLDDSLGTRSILLVALESSPNLARFLHGHDNRVTGVAFTPDGATAVSGSWDRRVIFWDLATGQPRGAGRAVHGGMIWSVAISPDGTRAASGGTDKRVALWDVATGEPIGQPLLGHTNDVTRVTFSPDGRLLASADTDGAIILWDLATGAPAGEPLRGLADDVWGLAFSPDGRLLASGHRDGSVIFWDVARRRPLTRPLRAHGGWVRGVAFSPDGQLLASASGDRTVILWDVATAQPSGQRLEGHSNTVASVAFSPDGTRLATAGVDNTVMVWDVRRRVPVGLPLKGHLDWVWSVAFSPDGTRLISGGFDGNVILWDMTGGQGLGRALKQHRGAVLSVAASPDGTTLASGGEDRSIILWDAASGRSLGPPLPGHDQGVRALAFSPDGRLLASGSYDRTAIVWDVASRARLLRLPRQELEVIALAFSPDGRLLATGSCSKLGDDEDCAQVAVRIWNPTTGELIRQVETEATSILWSLAFSPDGKLLACGIGDDAVVLWDTSTWELVGEPLVSHKGPVRGLAFSPDGKTLATGSADNTLLLWSVERRQPLAPPIVGYGGVWSVAFSPDGKTLAFGSGDRTISLWDVPSGQRIGQHLVGHDDAVRSVAFSADSQTLISGGADGQVILWDLDVTSWLARACSIAGRSLTPEEWRRHVGNAEYQETCGARGWVAERIRAAGRQG